MIGTHHLTKSFHILKTQSPNQQAISKNKAQKKEEKQLANPVIKLELLPRMVV